MIKIDLLKQYPDLIQKCREWDCSYGEAISRLKQRKEIQTRLNRFEGEFGV